MQNIPEEVKIGIGNRPNHQYFNDMVPLQQHPFPHKISSITIQHNKDHVWGIKIIYKAANGKDVKGESSLKFKPLKRLFTSLTKDTFNVADDDFISEVHGYADAVINQIGFTTYKGHSKQFGPQKGAFFKYHFPQHTFVAARGAYDQFLDFIAFRVVRLPEAFIQKHCPPTTVVIENVPYRESSQQAPTPVQAPNSYPNLPPPNFNQPQQQPQYNQQPSYQHSNSGNYASAPTQGYQQPPPVQGYQPPPSQGQYQQPPQQYPPQAQYQQPQGQYQQPYPQNQGQYQAPPGQYQQQPGYQPPPQQYPQQQQGQYAYQPPGQTTVVVGQQQPQYLPPQKTTEVIIVGQNQQPPPQKHHSGVGTGLVMGALIGAELAGHHHHRHHNNVVVVEKGGHGHHGHHHHHH